MKVYEPQLKDEEIKALEADEFNTKIVQAVIECRFDSIFSLLDRRGEVGQALESIFPDDDSQKTDLEIEIGLEAIKISNSRTKTESYFEIKRAFFSRQNIVPTTLPHFSKIAIEHLSKYEELFPDLKEIKRFGFRIKQFNLIPEEKIKKAKNNFSNNFLGINTFSQKLRSKNVNVSFDDYKTVFNLRETLNDSKKIHDYFIKLEVGLVSESKKIGNILEEDKKYYFFTDMDFSLRFNKQPILFENTKIFCKRVVQRAEEIHKLILEEIYHV